MQRTRATAVAARPEGDGGNSSLWQEPGRPGRPAPTALTSGRTNRPKRQPGDSPETSTNGSYPSKQEKTSQHCESKTPQAETRGSRTRKQNISRSACFPKSEGHHYRWNRENGLQKEKRHDSSYDQAQREPVPSQNLQENSHARFFQLDTTTARRNQPVTRQSVLRQAQRGRGKARPAQAR